MNKTLKQILILFTLILVLVLPYFVFAEGAEVNMKSILSGVGKAGGYETDSVDQSTISTTLGSAAGIFLEVLGLIFVGLMLYGGYVYMMSKGNDQEVDRGLGIIRRTIVGLIIILGSWAIWAFISQIL